MQQAFAYAACSHGTCPKKHLSLVELTAFASCLLFPVTHTTVRPAHSYLVFIHSEFLIAFRFAYHSPPLAGKAANLDGQVDGVVVL